MPADDRATAGLTRRQVLLGLAIVAVAFNMRPALASVGPVLDDLQTDLGMSGTSASLLTALGVLCLGSLAPLAAPLARRWGMEAVIAGVLVAIAVGVSGRVVAGPMVLFAGTVLVGGALAVANVLLPALIKRDLPRHTGTMMGVYTMTLSGSAAVAAGATVPLGDLIGQQWRGALGVWAVPAVIGLLVWAPQVRRRTSLDSPERRGAKALFRDAIAWQVTIFFGLQSLVFYAVLSWLPSVYRDEGYGAASAGVLLTVSTLAQIPVALTVPRLAGRAADQRVYAAGATLFTAAGLTAVIVAPTAAPYLWMVILGIGQGSTFALGLSMIVWRTATTADAALLSAMSQTIGYLLAAVGPLLIGALHDATDSWTPGLAALLVLTAPQLIAGALAGRARVVGTARA